MAHRNLASERVRIGLTQEEFAKEIGIAASTLNRYEKNGQMPPDFIKKAAGYFGCTTDYLLDLTNERVART